MPIIVVARLRLRDPSLLDEFFTRASGVLELAQKMDGNLGTDAFAEGQDVWWDVTAWEGRAAIEAFKNTEPHLSTIDLVDRLCSEASFVDWEQDSSELPDWQTSWRRLVADGRSATLTNASDANETRAFPAPVEPPASTA
jgi:heme-degrading monooxygenase HmoA